MWVYYIGIHNGSKIYNRVERKQNRVYGTSGKNKHRLDRYAACGSCQRIDLQGCWWSRGVWLSFLFFIGYVDKKWLTCKGWGSCYKILGADY